MVDFRKKLVTCLTIDFLFLTLWKVSFRTYIQNVHPGPPFPVDLVKNTHIIKNQWRLESIGIFVFSGFRFSWSSLSSSSFSMSMSFSLSLQMSRSDASVGSACLRRRVLLRRRLWSCQGRNTPARRAKRTDCQNSDFFHPLKPSGCGPSRQVNPQHPRGPSFQGPCMVPQ